MTVKSIILSAAFILCVEWLRLHEIIAYVFNIIESNKRIDESDLGIYELIVFMPLKLREEGCKKKKKRRRGRRRKRRGK